MTKEEAIKILELTRDGYLKKANNARPFAQGTFAEMFEDKTIALNMAICALRASNRPSDARKGEGWSTISVDENVGSNRDLDPSDIFFRSNGKEVFIRLGSSAINNYNYGVSDFLKGLMDAMVILTKE